MLKGGDLKRKAVALRGSCGAIRGKVGNHNTFLLTARVRLQTEMDRSKEKAVICR